MNIENTINPACPWYDMHQQFGPGNVKWCEERLCAFVNEPANAWSNMLFIVVGLFLIYLGLKAKHSSLKQFNYLFGLIVIFMGFASFAWHATNNYATQVLDFVGMYFYIYFLMCLSLYQFKLISVRTGFFIFSLCVFISTGLILISQKLPFPYQIIIVLAASIVAALQVRGWMTNRNYPKRDLLWCLGFFVVAAGFSYADISRLFCDPSNHFIQGHAIWHVCCAVGTWFSYLVFSKQYQSRSDQEWRL